jgi:hypothetical protein
MSEIREKATCRRCRMELKGDAYMYGGSAYHPRTGERCPSNHYGGFVCSPECDYRASLDLEQTMPGHGTNQRSIGCYAQASYDRNWKN